MANPSIQFAKLDLASATIYSTASNFNSFIRINGNFTSGSTTVTNVDNYQFPTYFGTSSIMPGMYLASAGEVNAFTRIESWDNETKTIVLASAASATGTAATAVVAAGAWKPRFRNSQLVPLDKNQSPTWKGGVETGLVVGP
jgi:hypothetical protein